MAQITNPNFTSTTPTETGANLVGKKCYMKHDFAGGYLADEIVEIHSYTLNGNKFNIGKLGDASSTFEVNGDVLENGTATRAGLFATVDDWQVVNAGTMVTNNNLLSQIQLALGKIKLNPNESATEVDLRTPITLLENSNYLLQTTISGGNGVDFMLDENIISGVVESTNWANITTGLQFTTDADEPQNIRLRLDSGETLETFQITFQNPTNNQMSIKQDGSHKFGIEDSPLTIDGDTFIAEAMSFNKTAGRVDIDDSNGEPVGSTVIPGRIEGSGTLQLDGVNAPAVGDEFTLAGGAYAGDYIIQDIGETQSQGDYAKVSINFYKKIN